MLCLEQTRRKSEMPVLDERTLLKEIRAAGCTVQRLSKQSHFAVLDPNGKQIAWFAVKHPGHFVLAAYVTNVRKAIAALS